MYAARLLESVSHGEGYWSTQRIGVFRGEEQAGEFERNYPRFGVETFAPFERNGEWYALYSRKYVALSVMKLPSCEYLGGEDETNGFGFCPVEVFIPQYKIWEIKADPNANNPHYHKALFEKIYDPRAWKDDSKPGDEYYVHPEIHHENFAFLAGCVWGDDSSWKIECRDISRAHEGIIKNISEDWDYYEMPWKLNLRDSVRLSCFDYYPDSERCSVNIEIATTKTIRFNHTLGGDFNTEIQKF